MLVCVPRKKRPSTLVEFQGTHTHLALCNALSIALVVEQVDPAQIRIINVASLCNRESTIVDAEFRLFQARIVLFVTMRHCFLVYVLDREETLLLVSERILTNMWCHGIDRIRLLRFRQSKGCLRVSCGLILRRHDRYHVGIYLADRRLRLRGIPPLHSD